MATCERAHDGCTCGLAHLIEESTSPAPKTDLPSEPFRMWPLRPCELACIEISQRRNVVLNSGLQYTAHRIPVMEGARGSRSIKVEFEGYQPPCSMLPARQAGTDYMQKERNRLEDGRSNGGSGRRHRR
jgi:hypothetical protein